MTIFRCDLLALSDCSERMEVQYGESLRILMPRRADVLEFSPSYDPSDTQVVWRREWASRAVWSVVADLDHEGTYSARTDNDLELQRTCVTVIGTPHKQNN